VTDVGGGAEGLGFYRPERGRWSQGGGLGEHAGHKMSHRRVVSPRRAWAIFCGWYTVCRGQQ